MTMASTEKNKRELLEDFISLSSLSPTSKKIIESILMNLESFNILNLFNGEVSDKLLSLIEKDNNERKYLRAAIELSSTYEYFKEEQTKAAIEYIEIFFTKFKSIDDETYSVVTEKSLNKKLHLKTEISWVDILLMMALLRKILIKK